MSIQSTERLSTDSGILIKGDVFSVDLPGYDIVITDPPYLNDVDNSEYRKYFRKIISTFSEPAIYFQPVFRFEVFRGLADSIVEAHVKPNQHDYLVLFGIEDNYLFESESPIRSKNPRSVDLMEQIIERYTEQGNTVLDPFAGFGSTLIACRNTGRRYVGVEWDLDRFESAKERLS